MTHWRGVFPAVTTKLCKDESVDLDATAGSIDRLIANGVSGVIVLPMLGENASLTAEERDSVILAAKEAVAGRVPLLSGLAEISTEAAPRDSRLPRSQLSVRPESMMSSTMSTWRPVRSVSRSLRMRTTPEDCVPMPYDETAIQSIVTCGRSSRARSAMTITAPLSTPTSRMSRPW